MGEGRGGKGWVLALTGSFDVLQEDHSGGEAGGVAAAIECQLPADHDLVVTMAAEEARHLTELASTPVGSHSNHQSLEV